MWLTVVTMNKLFQQFSAFFEKHEWSFHQHADKPVLHTHFVGKKGRWQCVAVAREEDEVIVFLSLFPSMSPVNRRAACAELLTRLNYGLKHGSFQMDMEDGEIRFATSLMTITKEVSLDDVERLVFVNVSTMDDWYDAIMKVIHGGVSPEMAVARKEKQPKALLPKPRFEMN